MKLYFALFLCICFLLLSSCKNEIETVDPIDQGFDYAPLEVGNYWIYASDSIIYRQGGLITDSLSGFIREEIVDTFRDSEDLLNFKVQRFFKRMETDQWEETDLWFSSMSGANYIRVEENLKFISLVFPIVENVSWDGNAFFDENIEISLDGEPIAPYKNWDYEYEKIDTTYDNGQFSADQVVLIEQVDDDIEIEKRVASEMYAKGIGMVQKKMSILFCQGCAGDPDAIEDSPEYGFKLELNLIDHN